jgi:hypothetical protein
VVRQLSETNPDKSVYVNHNNAAKWFQDRDVKLEPVGQQVRSLLAWLSNNAENDGDPAKVTVATVTEIASVVGARATFHSVHYLLGNLAKEGLIQDTSVSASGSDAASFHLRLTFKGWEQADELSRTKKDSKRAFMAMAFKTQRLSKFSQSVYSPLLTTQDLNCAV